MPVILAFGVGGHPDLVRRRRQRRGRDHVTRAICVASEIDVDPGEQQLHRHVDHVGAGRNSTKEPHFGGAERRVEIGPVKQRAAPPPPDSEYRISAFPRCAPPFQDCAGRNWPAHSCEAALISDDRCTTKGPPWKGWPKPDKREEKLFTRHRNRRSILGLAGVYRICRFRNAQL